MWEGEWMNLVWYGFGLWKPIPEAGSRDPTSPKTRRAKWTVG